VIIACSPASGGRADGDRRETGGTSTHDHEIRNRRS
jgi:hypothetical protein